MGKTVFKYVDEDKREKYLERMKNSDAPVYADKTYILLLTGEDEKGSFYNYKIIEGRKEAFDYLLNLLKAFNEENEGYLDIEESKVLIDGSDISLEKAANVKRFMEYVSAKLDIPFDPDEYDKIK